MIKSKKQSMIIVGAFALVLMLFTTTYAFFNYTRTGTANTIRTGRIAFNSTQGTAINLTNMFPIDVTNGIPNDATKVGTVTINVTGDTTYTEGLEYLVSAVNVQNTVGTGQNAKSLPISIDVGVSSNTGNDPATTLGTSDDDYFTDRGGDTSYYKVLAGETINTNDQLVVGYIAPGSTGVDGNIVIRAYLDASRIAISDTYDGNETDNMGTTTEWIDDREVFTTTEWNALQTNGVSFQIKVESNEGVWVPRPVGPATFDTGSVANTKIKLLISDGEYTGQNKTEDKVNKYITFTRATIAPDISSFSSTNVISSSNSEMPIYVWYQKISNFAFIIYWYTDANDVYFNEDSSHFFSKIDYVALGDGFEDINTSNVKNMSYMFSYNENDIDSNNGFDVIASWDVASVTNMSHMFENNDYVNFSLFQNWNVSNVTNMSYMFKGTFNDATENSAIFGNASALNNWNVLNVTNFDYMFAVYNDSSYYQVNLNNFVYPSFVNRTGTWDNSIVQINNKDYYSGTYVPND